MGLKHGLSCFPDGRHTPDWRSWYDMVRRTIDPTCPNWKHYGARGIKVCERWHKDNPNGFLNFLSDMGCKPTWEHRIDRIDNDGDYTPVNCRWATQKEQLRNTSRNRLITVNGVTKCVAEWSELLTGGSNKHREVITGRLERGWSPERAISEPIHNLPQKISITIDGETHSIPEWSRIAGTKDYRIYQRRRYGGWTDRECVFGKNRR